MRTDFIKRVFDLLLFFWFDKLADTLLVRSEELTDNRHIVIWIASNLTVFELVLELLDANLLAIHHFVVVWLAVRVDLKVTPEVFTVFYWALN